MSATTHPPRIGTIPRRALLKLLGWTLLAGGQSRRLSILIFHRVFPLPDPFFSDEPHAGWFAEIAAMLRESFHPLGLLEAVERLADGTLPPRAVCVTFDDGYRDNLTVAWPILERHGIPATLFVASGYLDGGVMWNDRVLAAFRDSAGDTLDLCDLGLGVHPLGDPGARYRTANGVLRALKHRDMTEREALARAIGERIPGGIPSPMLTRAELKEAHARGMTIGGHTRTHPILACLDDTTARAEIADNKAELEGLLGSPVRLFAYPNGRPEQDFTATHVDMVKDLGYRGAVSTRPGVAAPGADAYRLPRYTPWDRTTLRFGVRMLANMRQVV